MAIRHGKALLASVFGCQQFLTPSSVSAGPSIAAVAPVQTGNHKLLYRTPIAAHVDQITCTWPHEVFGVVDDCAGKVLDWSDIEVARAF